MTVVKNLPDFVVEVTFLHRKNASRGVTNETAILFDCRRRILHGTQGVLELSLGKCVRYCAK